MSQAKQNLIRSLICALFAALLCVLSPFSVPIGDVPITLATLGVYICAMLQTPAMSAVSIALYLTIGLVGVPVFSGFTGGAAKLVGPTGGYLVGYLPMAAVISVIITLWRRHERRRGRAPMPIDIAARCGAALAGTAVLYTFGTAWFIIQTKTTVAAALPMCVLPFLPGDTAKIVVAALVSRALAPIVDRVSGL